VVGRERKRVRKERKKGGGRNDEGDKK